MQFVLNTELLMKVLRGLFIREGWLHSEKSHLNVPSWYDSLHRPTYLFTYLPTYLDKYLTNYLPTNLLMYLLFADAPFAI